MPLDVAGDVAEGLALAAQHAQRPGRLVAMSIRFAERMLRRHRHAVLQVAMALTEHLQVDRQHQRAAFAAAARSISARMNPLSFIT